jgi:putative transcriptional regulator
MSKRAFEKIRDGLEGAIAITEGSADPKSYRVHIPDGVDVKAIRKKMGLTQEEFAARHGFTLGRLRDWEQNRSEPEASHRILLTVLDKEPEAVARALATA